MSDLYSQGDRGCITLMDLVKFTNYLKLQRKYNEYDGLTDMQPSNNTVVFNEIFNQVQVFSKVAIFTSFKQSRFTIWSD